MDICGSISLRDTDRVAAHRGGPPVIPPYVEIGFIAVHLGDTTTEVIGNADRLSAALQEVRRMAVEQHGSDPATAHLADGDHFARTEGVPA